MFFGTVHMVPIQTGSYRKCSKDREGSLQKTIGNYFNSFHKLPDIEATTSAPI